ncbi:MAG: cell division protein FtsZ [Pseudomonadota bacterium]
MEDQTSLSVVESEVLQDDVQEEAAAPPSPPAEAPKRRSRSKAAAKTQAAPNAEETPAAPSAEAEPSAQEAALEPPVAAELAAEAPAEADALDAPADAAIDADALEPARTRKSIEDSLIARPRICVIGVGGGGGNAVNTMIRRELEGVDYLAANTDAQALNGSLSPRRLQLGAALTRGLGAGCRPEIGAAAAEERAAAIGEALEGAQMCFIAAGMGGGTGTGAAPVIARIAREKGVLTVGVVTKPFDFEGPRRRRIAENGVTELSAHVDTLIVIPNQNLFRVANERTTFADAFLMADEVLYQGVKGVTDLMTKPGLVNLDFADVRAVVDEMGAAMMGSGEATDENRAVEAAERAIDNPLLDELTLRGAKGVLINIVGGPDLKLYEVDAAANRVRQYADEDANIFFGSTIEPDMEGRIRVSVIATGIARSAERAPESARAEDAIVEEAAEAASTPITPAPAAAPAPSVEVEPIAPAAHAAPVEAEPAAPVQPEKWDEPAAPQQDELVRKLAETMTHDVAETAPSVSETVTAPSSTTAPRKTREGRVEIPSFLRRTAG